MNSTQKIITQSHEGDIADENELEKTTNIVSGDSKIPDNLNLNAASTVFQLKNKTDGKEKAKKKTAPEFSA